MKAVVFAIFATVVWASIPFSANVATAASIVVGNHELLPNTPGQRIDIMVSGDDMVEGLNFNLQVADGGTHPSVGGSIDGPKIQAVDLVTGTIFDGNNTGQVDTLELPQISANTVTTSTGMVAANGLLATIEVDTTGFMDGTFDLSLGNTRNGPTDFAGTAIDITDGTMSVVPEPIGLSIALIGAIGIYGGTRRRRNNV